MNKIGILLVALGASALTASAVPAVSLDPAPSYDITGRVRNGNTGFEAVLFTPADPSPGTAATQLNPVGAPIWNTGGNLYGQTYFNFQLTYTSSDGVAKWGIDFNKDGDYLDTEELATSDTAFDGKSFEYVGLFITGNGTVGADLKNFTINGSNLGDFNTVNTLDTFFEDSTGLFGDITATGSFTFTGNGSSEQPRIWVRLASPKDVNVPDAGATVGLLTAALAGLAAVRRKLA